MKHAWIVMILLLYLVVPVSAETYTVNNPRIVVHHVKHLVQFKWNAGSQKLVVVFKLTRSHQATPCMDDWGEYLRVIHAKKYCGEIYRQWVSGMITVQDWKWEQGEMYYILQYDYTSHNAPYGAFIPR